MRGAAVAFEAKSGHRPRQWRGLRIGQGPNVSRKTETAEKEIYSGGSCCSPSCMSLYLFLSLAGFIILHMERIKEQLMAAGQHGGGSTPVTHERLRKSVESNCEFLVVIDQLNATFICAQRS